MTYDLRPDEIRVLGVLIEKSLALPAYYPMTTNAITAACNQKNNREPVTQYTESEVSAAISSLRRRQLVDQAPPERNSRAIRFQHLVEQRYQWNAATRAIMCELMIRGPQTSGELKAHAGRMTHLESTEYAREILSELERCDPPMVVEMPLEAGKRERRFAQLLGGPPAPVPNSAVAVPIGMSTARSASGAVDSARLEEMEARLSKVEQQLAELMKCVM
ncbi:MAG: DUF480 domain-containing protein [Phycisphaerae bacterium]|nr:DUF480 domain-containing protein [Phycisphaerae bacterium]